ncbi:hypothetical protein SCLCIDRAFT_134658 [Scleroderma citrinum Foug A]|uniref:DUF6532 domain-containing protein n=1 Tax=Scleroderma citrinum Foug A TaxID=1036808 RepID=A0A0C3DHB0_9AGAM|nr:hypothetical protein SCLCIDRAFT_134658 [Scleroderma citrinum Foug A]
MLQASGCSEPVTDTSTKNSIGTKACSANNGDPKTLKYYSLVWKTILNHTRFLSRLDAVISNAFPEHQVYLSSKANKFITQAVAELQENGMPPDKVFLRDQQHHMGNLVFEDLGTFHSDFRKIAQPIVAKHWDWEPVNQDYPQELLDHVLSLYNELTEGTKYVHSKCDNEGNFDNFSSSALQELCVVRYYTGKSCLTSTFPDIFSKCLPASALAFAATAVSFYLFIYF